jgi:hypothetical protein
MDRWRDVNASGYWYGNEDNIVNQDNESAIMTKTRKQWSWFKRGTSMCHILIADRIKNKEVRGRTFLTGNAFLSLAQPDYEHPTEHWPHQH